MNPKAVARIQALLAIRQAIVEVRSAMVPDDVCPFRHNGACRVTGRLCLYNGTAPKDCPLPVTVNPGDPVTVDTNPDRVRSAG